MSIRPNGTMLELLQQDADVWDLFTRKEEYAPGLRDEFDRFPYYLSSHRNLFEPTVSKYLYDHGYGIEYPDGQPFAVCLTHDIDTIYQSPLFKGYTALQSLRSGDLQKSIGSISQIQSKKIPLCNFQEIMALEEQYGATSSFYFLALAPGDQDYRYDIRDIETEIGTIADAGWEVGLHGGHRAYCNLEQLLAEKERLEKILNRPVIGYRNHYLRFRVPETWKHLAEAGFSYDTTLGYPDCIGFKNGMCHPFRPYDLNASREIDILEIPLTIMDTTLNRYMRLDAKRAWAIIHRLIDATERCGGVITTLWHNTQMEGEHLKLYEKVLRHCTERGAWMTSGEEIMNAVKVY